MTKVTVSHLRQLPNQICMNCGLPGAGFTARIHLRAGNGFRRERVRSLPFCNRECVTQFAWLQLETYSTANAVSRVLGGKPVSYREFRLLAPIEVVEVGSDQGMSFVEDAVSCGEKGPRSCRVFRHAG